MKYHVNCTFFYDLSPSSVSKLIQSVLLLGDMIYYSNVYFLPYTANQEWHWLFYAYYLKINTFTLGAPHLLYFISQTIYKQ